MKTKLLAIIAVLAMAFAGAAVIAQDSVSDADDDPIVFGSDSKIDMFGKNTTENKGIVAYHYATDNGMLHIKLEKAIAGHAAIVISSAEDLDAEGTTTTVYDPINGGDELYVNAGEVTSGYYVYVFAHGADLTDESEAKAGCVIKTITTSSITFNANGEVATAPTLSDLTRSQVPTMTQDAGTKILAGWSTTADTTAELDATANLEDILENSTWTVATPNATIYAVWADSAVTVTFNWNKPSMTTERFVYASGGSASTSDVDVPTSLTISKDGTTYISSEQEAYALYGYTFAGWYTKAVGGTQATLQTAQNAKSIQAAFEEELGTISNENTLNLYAHWTVGTYTITYDISPTAAYTITGTAPANWNKDSNVSFDCMITLPTWANLQSRVAADQSGATLAINDGYVFSHWKISSVSYTPGEKYENLVGFTQNAVTITAVYDLVVTVSPSITQVDIVPQNRVTGYEYLIDGDEATPSYNFKVYYDSNLYTVALGTITGGTGSLANYDPTDKSATFTSSSVTGPFTVNLTVTKEFYTITVNEGTSGSVQVNSTTVTPATENSKYTVTWTKYVPKDEFGMLTVSAKGSDLTDSYVYTLTSETGTIAKVSDKTWKITPTADMTITIADAAATGATSKISDLYIASISNGAAVGYINAIYGEVPAGAITATGTLYTVEGGITAYTNLKTGTNYSVAYKDITVSVDDPSQKSEGSQTALGTGANEYKFTITPTVANSYLYALSATYTATTGGTPVTSSTVIIS